MSLAPELERSPAAVDGGEVLVFPTSFAQQRLWFLDQLEGETPFYNLPGAVRFDGPLDLPVLRRVLEYLVERHESLRTTFDLEEGQPVQIVAPPGPVPFPVVDLSALDPVRRTATARWLATREGRRSFDLSVGPLLRIALLDLGRGEDGGRVALFTLHHIVSDGWSMEVLYREVEVLYSAFVRGLPSPLAALEVQYADFAVWQRDWLQGSVLERLVGYWRDRLAGLPPVLELPTDHPRPPHHGYRGARCGFAVPAPVAAELEALGRRHGCTGFVTILAVLKVLLHRYTGRHDLVVGTDVANRNRAELEGLIGFFVNQLVLRTDLGGDPSFDEVLSRVRQTVLEAYDHQDLPFDRLVDELELERDLSYTPVYQVTFTLDNPRFRSGGGSGPDRAGLAARTMAIEAGVARFDLAFLAGLGERGLVGALEYRTDLFERATVAAMAGHLEELLAAAAEDPGRRVSELPMLRPTERRQLLDGWNDTARDYPLDRPVTRLFEAQVARTPAAVAVIDGEHRLTYDRLNRRANRWAHRLGELGVTSDVLAALLFERGADLLTGMLAVFKARGAYLPLEPEYPPERVRRLLVDSGCRMVLVADGLAGRLETGLAEVPAVERPCWLTPSDLDAAEGPAGDPVTAPPPAGLAYVIYTSGSTGRPKGAMIEHRGMVNHLFTKIEDLGLAGHDVIPQTASACFDISVWQFLAPLLYGGAAHVFDDREARGGRRLLELAGERRVAGLEVVPSQLRLILEELALSPAAPPPLPTVRWLISTGEALPVDLARRWLETYPEALVINAWGATECSDDVTHYRLARPPAARTLRIAVGGPAGNSRTYCLDPSLSPVPAGVPSELFIGGAGVGRGYYREPRRTAEAFCPDPHAGRPGASMYRTGDQGFWTRDGMLQFLGRVDHQVKIRGYRIELGEIEAVLARQPGVQAAAAVVREDGPGVRRLVACVVPQAGPGRVGAEGSGGLGSRLRSALARELPEYMVPALYVPLESLPLNANGKVDRRALAALPLPAPSTGAPPSEPSGEVEELLAGIWRRVLALDAVGVEDNFFELGGDSILGLRIVAEAHRAGLRLSVRDLFQHQTIATLAPGVERGDRPVAAEQGAVTGAVSLTPPQWRFFALELPRPHHYTQSLLLETGEPLRSAWLAVVVRRLLEHHDALRFRYVVEEGRWRQFAEAPGGVLPFSVVDLAALGEDVGAAVEAVAASTQASLDLGQGPLLRMVYLDLGPHRSWRLLVVVHHLVMDGVSWRILLEDLEAVYRQVEGGGPVALPPKTTSFKEWAERLRALQRTRGVQEELAVWSSEARRRVAPLPRDFEDGENLQATASTVVVAVDADATAALLQEVPRAGTTGVVDVLLAALARVLTAWAGGRPVLVDLEDHGRDQELFEEVDLSRTVGWFTSEYPVLLDEGSGTSPGEALASVRVELRRVPRRGLGYGLLVARELAGEAPARLLALPRPEAIFNYHGQVDQTLGRESPFRMAPERKGSAQDPASRRQHLIEIDASVSGGRLRTSWVFGAAVHREATIRRLAERFVAAVGEVVAHVTGGTSDAYTPADFDLADLDQEQLDAVLGKIRGAGGGIGR